MVSTQQKASSRVVYGSRGSAVDFGVEGKKEMGRVTTNTAESLSGVWMHQNTRVTEIKQLASDGASDAVECQGGG